MRAVPAGVVRRGAALAVLAGLMTWAVTAGQAQPTKTDEKKTDEKKVEPKIKRYPFEAAERPWSRVFDWLTEITGKPLITTNKPTGSFSFKGPANKEYTLGEIIDIINDA